MTPAQSVRQSIMALTPLERLELGSWLWDRRPRDHEAAGLALHTQRLVDRVRVDGVNVVAQQDGVTPAAIYTRLNRAGIHLRDKQLVGPYKPGNEPRPQPCASDAAHSNELHPA